jgi:isocitrate lyase
MNNKISYRGGATVSNQEGYRDTTADQAIHNASKMPKPVKDVFRALQAVANLHGFKIIGLKDKKTGKVWWR